MTTTNPVKSQTQCYESKQDKEEDKKKQRRRNCAQKMCNIVKWLSFSLCGMFMFILFIQFSFAIFFMCLRRRCCRRRWHHRPSFIHKNLYILKFITFFLVSTRLESHRALTSEGKQRQFILFLAWAKPHQSTEGNIFRLWPMIFFFLFIPFVFFFALGVWYFVQIKIYDCNDRSWMCTVCASVPCGEYYYI